MTVIALTYKAGQTYDIDTTVAVGIRDEILADSEIGALFRVRFTDAVPVRVEYRRIAYRKGSNILRAAESYNPRIEGAIVQVEPPNRTEIDAATLGDIYSYSTPEAGGPIGYSIITEISGRKYAQHFDFALDGPDIYRQGVTYYVGAWPHVSTVEPGAIFVWGQRKYIAIQVGTQIIYEDFIEEISWPLNTIWGPPPTLSDPLDVNWAQIEQWSAFNTATWPQRGVVDTSPSLLNTILNFAGYIGWNLTIEIIDISGGAAGLSAVNYIAGGMAFEVAANTGMTIEFYLGSPIEIDRLAVDIKADQRVRDRYSSGRFAIETIRNPRNPKARFRSADLLGVGEAEAIRGDDGYIAGPFAAPFPAAEISTIGVSDRLRFTIDNRNIPFSSTLELTNWQIHHVEIRPKYRVDFDPSTRTYTGRSLDGSPNVILTTQEADEGWIQEVDSAFDMEQLPDLNRDETRGFYTAESFWGTVNNTFWWCSEDDRQSAQWEPQYTVGVAHPLERLWLRTYDAYASGNQFSSFNSGLFLDVEQADREGSVTRAFSFVENRSFLSYVNPALVDAGYAVSNISIFRNDNRSSGISLEAGNPLTSLLSSFIPDGEIQTEGQIPGGDITIAAGDALYGAKGGDITITAGRSLGQGMPGGNIILELPEPYDSNFHGFAPRADRPLDEQGDRGYFAYRVPIGPRTNTVYFPNSFPRVGQGLLVDRVEIPSLTDRRAYLEWDTVTGEIVRSAIPPVARSIEPPWQIWYEETSRVLRKYTWAVYGGLYHPVPVPWCCSPEKEYTLYKPFIINRGTENPTSVRSRPAWQLWFVETDTTLRMFTWARDGSNYIPVALPWTQVMVDGLLVPETIMTKPGTGTSDEIPQTEDAQIMRQSYLPSTSQTRPNWDLWIRENMTSIYFYTHAKIGDTYHPVPIPLGLSINDDGNIVQEYALTKPDGSQPTKPITQVGEIIKRSSDLPQADEDRPAWEIWIQDTGNSLKWFTHAYIRNNDQFPQFISSRVYVPIAIPWMMSFDGSSFIPETEILR